MPSSAPGRPPRKRAIVYVDGFNLFYGVLKGSSHKWLNLERFFCRLRQDDDVQKIRYFTAEVKQTSTRRFHWIFSASPNFQRQYLWAVGVP